MFWWRVINAADYGFPQRRKRVFIVAFHKSTNLYKELTESEPIDYILKSGILAQTFPIVTHEDYSKVNSRKINGTIESISESFVLDKNFEKFENTGIMVGGVVHTLKTKSNYEDGFTYLKDIVELNKKVDNEFYLDEENLPTWEYLKGAKNKPKVNSFGIKYNYSEGAMTFPDNLNKASRTIITGEGGKSPSRFKHVIDTKFGKRRLTPVELERLNMFPDNHTKFEGVSNAKRAFFMGNALVVGVVEKIGETLYNKISE